MPLNFSIIHAGFQRNGGDAKALRQTAQKRAPKAPHRSECACGNDHAHAKKPQRLLHPMNAGTNRTLFPAAFMIRRVRQMHLREEKESNQQQRHKAHEPFGMVSHDVYGSSSFRA